MKILVPTKPVLDPDQRIRITADGTAVDQTDMQWILNPFDAIAVEEALRIREGGRDDTEIVTVGIGSSDIEKTLRIGLAMGADRALLVECPTMPDPWNIAQLLRAVVDRERSELVLMGKQAVDDDSNQVGQFLAALLDWPQATFASKLSLSDGRLTVEREVDTGIEMVESPLPAVVTVDLRLNEPRYASLPQMMKAKRKPVDLIGVEDLGVVIEPRVQQISVDVPLVQRRCVRVGSVDELVAKLTEEAKVI